MTRNGMLLSALLISATFTAPAIAGQQILLPNGVNVNYEGTSAPVFYAVQGPNRYYEAFDSSLDARFVYSETGTWLGTVSISGAALPNIPNAPAVPTEVTLPPSPGNATGLTIPYAGQGIPTVILDAQGNYIIIDAVSHSAQVLDATGSFIGSGGWGSGAQTTGSSSFGSSPIGASSTTTGGDPILGGSSGTPTTSGVVGTTSGTPTTSGTTSSGCISNCGTSGGGTDVPAPAVFGLFGMAAGGLALARRRRRKAA